MHLTAPLSDDRETLIETKQGALPAGGRQSSVVVRLVGRIGRWLRP
jgi:hypothetical protein